MLTGNKARERTESKILQDKITYKEVYERHESAAYETGQPYKNKILSKQQQGNMKEAKDYPDLDCVNLLCKIIQNKSGSHKEANSYLKIKLIKRIVYM